ncbi:MAG: site-specific integrase, partial [Halobacteriales archaeon]|nr:site-specific integrase [Halobacteriales archaeon]
MEYHGRSKRTQDAYLRVLTDFQLFLNNERNAKINNATHRDCMAWLHGIRKISSPSTIATYA